MPLKIYKRKSGLFHLRGTFQGRRVDRSLGTRDKVIADRLRQAAEQEIVREEIHGPLCNKTFEEAALGYMNAGKSGRFLAPIIEHLAGRKVAHIVRADLDDIARIHYPGRSDATINRQVYAPGSAVLNYAAEQGWRAPFRVKKRAESKGKTRWLRVEEAERLFANAGHLQTFVSLALESGARSGELLDLDYDDVDVEDQRFMLWDDETKAKRQRFGHFGTRTKSLLTRRAGAVITNTKGVGYSVQTGTGSTIAKQFRTACKKAGITDATPHTLRHTWATWAMAIDPNMIRVKAHGGWSSTGQLERYAKLAPHGYGQTVLKSGWELFGKYQ